jgi:TolB-like protein/DNA-binding winged helix-turn-helix (wHTH) protein
MPSATKHPQDLFRFANFELDPLTGELRAGQALSRLQPQPLKLLLVLLRRPGELVSREELKQELMPDAAYGDFDHAINIAVSKLRTALNDSSDSPRLIETLPRRGYRFVGNVEYDKGAPGIQATQGVSVRRGFRLALTGHWGRWRVLTVAGCGVTALALLLWLISTGVRQPGATNAIRSLAVLPLTNLSQNPEQEYFSEGMTDALITELSQISSLRVISRTSVMHYQGTSKSAPEIAKELKVDGIVEGSVTRAGDRVRINVQLIDARSDTHLWARNYDRDLRDVLSLQSEVALSIAGAVRAQITPDLKVRMARNRTVEPEAYDFYLKGRYQAEKYTQADLKAGIEYLRRAIQIDPNYASAYADLSIIYANSDDFFLPPKEAMPEASAAAKNALKLNESLPEAHFAMACVDFTYGYEMSNAEREFKRAIELAPRNNRARYYYGFYLVNTGQFDKGIEESRHGVESDPLSLEANAYLGMNLYFARRYAEAVEQFHAMVDMEPNYWLSHMFLGLTYEQQGHLAGALEELQKAHSLESAAVWPLAELGHVYARLGRRKEAEHVLKELVRRSKQGYVPAYNLATVYAGLGSQQQALTFLEKGYSDHSAMMVWLNVDPELDTLRSNPRFVDLLRRMELSR